MGEKTSRRNVHESSTRPAYAEKTARVENRDGAASSDPNSRIPLAAASGRESHRGSLTLALIALLWLVTGFYLMGVFFLLHGRERYEDFAV